LLPRLWTGGPRWTGARRRPGDNVCFRRERGNPWLTLTPAWNRSLPRRPSLWRPELRRRAGLWLVLSTSPGTIEPRLLHASDAHRAPGLVFPHWTPSASVGRATVHLLP